MELDTELESTRYAYQYSKVLFCEVSMHQSNGHVPVRSTTLFDLDRSL